MAFGNILENECEIEAEVTQEGEEHSRCCLLHGGSVLHSVTWLNIQGLKEGRKDSRGQHMKGTMTKVKVDFHTSVALCDSMKNVKLENRTFQVSLCGASQ